MKGSKNEKPYLRETTPSAYGVRLKDQKMKGSNITLGKTIQAWVVVISSNNEVVVLRSVFCDVRISFFNFIPTQHLYIKYFHPLLVSEF